MDRIPVLGKLTHMCLNLQQQQQKEQIYFTPPKCSGVSLLVCPRWRCWQPPEMHHSGALVTASLATAQTPQTPLP